MNRRRRTRHDRRPTAPPSTSERHPEWTRRPSPRVRLPPARSVPTQEQVRPPRLVALVGEIRREQRVHVAARLERRPVEAEPGFLDRLAALAVIARLAGGDEVL